MGGWGVRRQFGMEELVKLEQAATGGLGPDGCVISGLSCCGWWGHGSRATPSAGLSRRPTARKGGRPPGSPGICGLPLLHELGLDLVTCHRFSDLDP